MSEGMESEGSWAQEGGRPMEFTEAERDLWDGWIRRAQAWRVRVQAYVQRQWQRETQGQPVAYQQLLKFVLGSIFDALELSASPDPRTIEGVARLYAYWAERVEGAPPAVAETVAAWFRHLAEASATGDVQRVTAAFRQLPDVGLPDPEPETE